MATHKTVILITGANSGIGYETVVALAQTSADFHIILGARTEEKGKAALSSIQATHGDSLKGSISFIQIDVTKQETIAAAKAHVEQQFGKLDVLINNAGIIAYQEADAIEATRRTFEVNVLGPMAVTDAFEPLLKRSVKPYVVHVSSEQGSITNRLDPEFRFRQHRGESYRVSKAALNMLAACHRYNFTHWEEETEGGTEEEKNGKGKARVLAFNPGFCVTNLTGEKGREMRTKAGARHASEPARALADVVRGNRDGDIEKNAMVDVDGGVMPW